MAGGKDGKRIWIQCQNSHCGSFTCDKNTWEPPKSTCKGLGLAPTPAPAAIQSLASAESGPNNRARKLMKKLNEIQQLKRKQGEGEELEENQLGKIENEAELQAQLDAMGHGDMEIMSPTLGSKRKAPPVSDDDDDDEEAPKKAKKAAAGGDIDAMRSKLTEMGTKKAAAVEAEDYGAAKKLKAEIDNLTEQIEAAEKAAKAAEKAAKAAAEKAAKEKAAKAKAAKEKAAAEKAAAEKTAKAAEKAAKAKAAAEKAAKAKAAAEEANQAQASKKRKKSTVNGDLDSLRNQLKELTAKKSAAVEAEDYGAAKKLKGEIDNLTEQITEAEAAAAAPKTDVAALQKQLAVLTAKKSAAVEAEDYGAAKKLKGEIDSITAEIEASAGDDTAAKEAEEAAAAAKEAEEAAAKAKAKAAKKVAALEAKVQLLTPKKAAAVEAEDYGAAKKIKGEIDAATAEIETLK